MQLRFSLSSLAAVVLALGCTGRAGDVTDPSVPTRLEIVWGDQDTVYISLPGGTRLGARLLNARGDQVGPAAPAWQVQDTAVATIAADGSVTPRSAGRTAVTARMPLSDGRTLADTVGLFVIPLR